jgi:dolichyl-phosphate beta-glucosyltransferase
VNSPAYKLTTGDPRLAVRTLASPAYSIIIPAFNERARITATLDKILAFSRENQWDAEIIVVNDGSSDNTAEIVTSYMQRNQQLRLVENPGNRGKGYSVRHGMLQAQGGILLFSDADLSSPISEANKLLSAINCGADVGIGSRWLDTNLQIRKQPLYRQLFSRIFNLALRIFLGLKFKDTQCGFKAFTREVAAAIFPLQQIERWGFDPELVYLAQRHGFTVVEVPVAWAHSSGTRLHPLRDGIRMFGDVLKIRWNSMRGRYGQQAVGPNPL